MNFQRLSLLGLVAALPLLAACNQTTASPPAAPVVAAELASNAAAPEPAAGSEMGAGVRAALADAQATRERQNSDETTMNVLSFFDPIGITALAKPAMEANHQRELDEKYRRVDEEVQKTIAEAEAIKARSQAGPSAKPRKRASAAAD